MLVLKPATKSGPEGLVAGGREAGEVQLGNTPAILAEDRTAGRLDFLLPGSLSRLCIRVLRGEMWPLS